MKRRRLRAFDRRILAAGHSGLLGIDEAGRGALAGPVVAAAVAIRAAFYDSRWCRRNASKVDDSKRLAPGARDWLYERILWLESEDRLHVGVGLGEVEQIEELNILGATQLAMNRAADQALAKAGVARRDPDPLFESALLEIEPTPTSSLEAFARWRALVDGKPLKALSFPHLAFVNGDGRSLCIAMASIVAKVVRDRIMSAFDETYETYGFGRCKGYATAAHREAIGRLGPTPIHRKAFLRKLLDGREPPGQATLPFMDAEAWEAGS